MLFRFGTKNRLKRMASVVFVVLSLGLLGCGPGGSVTENDATEPAIVSDGGGTSSANENASQEGYREASTESTAQQDDGAEPEKGLVPESPMPRTQLPMRGITLSAPRDGRIWATSGVETTTLELQTLGVNWITYHPYAWIRNDGTLIFEESMQQAIVQNPIRVGKKLNVKVMLKPHIGYWGSKFGWRGDIQFGDDEEAWTRFFDHYKRWIVVQAKIAEVEGAELFAMGTEYKLTLQRKEWLDIIKAVRAVYKGKITYAANWDVYDKVPFWDKLDYIGIQAYFPLSDVVPPKESDVIEGWKKLLPTLQAYSEKLGRPIIFTEMGYNLSAYAAQKPWDYEQGGPMADETKLLCMKVALEQLKAPGFIEGVFLWKWYPDGRTLDRDFNLQYPAMKDLLKSLWLAP